MLQKVSSGAAEQRIVYGNEGMVGISRRKEAFRYVADTDSFRYVAVSLEAIFCRCCQMRWYSLLLTSGIVHAHGVSSNSFGDHHHFLETRSCRQNLMLVPTTAQHTALSPIPTPDHHPANHSDVSYLQRHQPCSPKLRDPGDAAGPRNFCGKVP